MMNENQVISHVHSMDHADKIKVYLSYYVDMIHSKYTDPYYDANGYDNWRPVTSEQFLSEANVIVHDAGTDWDKHGFALQYWINFSAPSIYHHIYHGI